VTTTSDLQLELVVEVAVATLGAVQTQFSEPPPTETGKFGNTASLTFRLEALRAVPSAQNIPKEYVVLHQKCIERVGIRPKQ
jgi:hypothetical protein